MSHHQKAKEKESNNKKVLEKDMNNRRVLERVTGNMEALQKVRERGQQQGAGVAGRTIISQIVPTTLIGKATARE